MSFDFKYEGKKVLVTGHTGFKGGWLISILHKLGAEVLGYALAPEFSHGIYHASYGDKKCKSVIADIRDKEQLKKTLEDFQPDFVFHLAAQPLVLKSYSLPSETFHINVVGTSNLLEALIGLDKKCSVIVVTTDKVYQNNEWAFPYRENDILGGHDPYSASKACTELVVSSFRKSFFNSDQNVEHRKNLVSARAGNVIGGGDYSEKRIIPDLVEALSNKRELILRNPNAVRPWQHVLEPLFGYLRLAILMDQKPSSISDSYNFGPLVSDCLTVEELTKCAISVWEEGTYVIDAVDQHHEANTLKLDISLAQKDLNWTPVYNSETAIRKTIEWYKSDDKVAITNEQIDTYLNEI